MYSTVMIMTRRNMVLPELIEYGGICALLWDKVKVAGIYTAIYILYFKERVKKFVEEFVVSPEIESAFLKFTSELIGEMPYCSEGTFSGFLPYLGLESKDPLRLCKVGDVFLVFRVPMMVKKEKFMKRLEALTSHKVSF